MKLLSKQKTERMAVILAGGDGSRLKSLTRTIAGDERPKQFCPILHDETLLDATRRRVGLTIEPENIFYSLTRKHERYFRPLLSNVCQSRQIVQPENKGTAPAILSSLFRLARINPAATVAFFPSDHYFSDDAAFMKSVEAAFGAAETIPDSLILLGIEADAAETSYGWIEPVESLFGGLSRSVSRVRRFWEKPSFDAARNLLAKGCLWNSFVMVGKVGAFLSLFEKHLPELYRVFAGAATGAFGQSSETVVMRSLYAWITDANFSSDVLEKSAERLYVLRAGGVKWSDWGEPERVLGTLSALGVRPHWQKLAAA
jgi:mannose-1-phosphate guanylyltransferase